MEGKKQEPLFVRFANGDANSADVVGAMAASENKKSADIAKAASEKLPDMSQFKADFKEMLGDLAENGVSRRIVNYIDSYMKPSLEEFIESPNGSRAGENRWVAVKADDAPWPEAVVCYNLCIYIKMYGHQAFKRCPVCKRFFTHKGKYAKYCSDSCKQAGK